MTEKGLKGLIFGGAAAICAGAAVTAVRKGRKAAKRRKYLKEFCDGPCFFSFKCMKNGGGSGEAKEENGCDIDGSICSEEKNFAPESYENEENLTEEGELPEDDLEKEIFGEENLKQTGSAGFGFGCDW